MLGFTGLGFTGRILLAMFGIFQTFHLELAIMILSETPATSAISASCEKAELCNMVIRFY